jgi:hypothetical protein
LSSHSHSALPFVPWSWYIKFWCRRCNHWALSRSSGYAGWNTVSFWWFPGIFQLNLRDLLSLGVIDHEVSIVEEDNIEV